MALLVEAFTQPLVQGLNRVKLDPMSCKFSSLIRWVPQNQWTVTWRGVHKGWWREVTLGAHSQNGPRPVAQKIKNPIYLLFCKGLESLLAHIPFHSFLQNSPEFLFRNQFLFWESIFSQKFKNLRGRLHVLKQNWKIHVHLKELSHLLIIVITARNLRDHLISLLVL